MAARTLLALLFVLGATWPTLARADAVAQAERAFAHGDLERALALLRAPAARKQPRALTVRGRIYQAQGKSDEAERDLYAVIDLYNSNKIRERDGTGLWAVAEAAQRLGAFRNANDAFAKALKASPHNRDIEVAWAELFFSKHDLRSAELSLTHALTQQEHARALELLARVRLEQGAPFVEVEELLTRALKRDPELAMAHTTRAGMLLRDEELGHADLALDRALAINPRDLVALSVRAAVRFVAADSEGFARAVEAVLRENPRYSQLYSIVATYAEWEHRYPELVQLADAALRVDPQDAAAHATRGLNLLRIGREAEGRAALKQAFELDRYNLLVFNTLNLYEQVIDVAYESHAAAPFVVRLHKEERPALEPYLLPLLHEAYESMAKRYGIRPQGPLYIELYASERDFAVRTSGLPRIGIQGVCFGNTLAAVSPRAAQVNFGQVVWHELSHVFHVALSNGRVPRWLTEGLAEHETERARHEWRREDDRPLWDALRTDRLPHLRSLNHAFTHARDIEELMVAYYASARAVAYIQQRFGDQAIARLLRGFGEGLGSEQLFARELGMSLEQLDSAFRSAELARLSAKYAHDFRADPSELTGPFAASHQALSSGQLPEARTALQQLIAAGHDGYQPRMLLARTLHKLGDDQGALAQLDAAIAIDPEREEAYVLMTSLADALHDAAHLTLALERWSALDQHAREPLARYLALLAAKEDYTTLRRRAEAGLYVDPESSELHRLYALALAHAGKLPQAHIELGRALSLARNQAQVALVQRSQQKLHTLLPTPAKTRQKQADAAISR